MKIHYNPKMDFAFNFRSFLNFWIKFRIIFLLYFFSLTIFLSLLNNSQIFLIAYKNTKLLHRCVQHLLYFQLKNLCELFFFWKCSSYLYLTNFVTSSTNIDDELTSFYETITKMLLRKNIIINLHNVTNYSFINH
jgi:hypothetical protein